MCANDTGVEVAIFLFGIHFPYPIGGDETIFRQWRFEFLILLLLRIPFTCSLTQYFDSIVACDDLCIELFYFLFVTPCFLLLLSAENRFRLFDLSRTR